MLLNQRVAGATDALHDQGHEKQGNSCRSQKFWCWCPSRLCSDSTAPNCYVRGSIHGIYNKLTIAAFVQRLSRNQGRVHGGTAGEAGCIKVLEGEGSPCEHEI